MGFKLKDISLAGGTIEILTIDAVNPNAPECYSIGAIKSVIPTFQENVGINGINTDQGTYPFKDRKTITITFHDESSNPSIKFDLEEINNQPGWTLDLAGVIQAVNDICGWISSVVGPASGLATEATAISILNAIVASDQDVEILLVRDTVTLIVYQQITDYQTGVPVVTYKDVNGTPFVPVNPMEYLDPSAVLNLILTQNTSLNTPVTGLAANMLRVTGAGAASVTAGKRRVAFFNAGNNDSTVAGAILEKGEVITFSADGLRDTLAAISYDALTSELLITTVG